jgi:hypothetical protein
MYRVPRLSNAEYLKRHQVLKRAWFEFEGRHFAYLSSREQWDLHAYYQPSKDLTDEELLEHRRKIAKDELSLPARAGKAWANLVAGRDTGATRSFDGKRWITLRAIVKPEIDVKLLSRALVELAKQEAQAEVADRVPPTGEVESN